MAVMEMTMSVVALAALAAMVPSAQSQAAEPPRVISLTQLPCQFLESEGVDRGYKSAKKADCDAINGKTGADRLAKSKVIESKPGKHVFRVKNESVPYELGFWLRGEGLKGRATLPSVSGGGLTRGKTQDYEIELRPGNYLYSCPLNTTPDYKLTVK